MNTIIASVISASVALIVCLITTHAQNEKSRALIEYRLEELTKEVQKHNSLIDRTYKLEQDAALHAEQIKSVQHRVDELEKVG